MDPIYVVFGLTPVMLAGLVFTLGWVIPAIPPKPSGSIHHGRREKWRKHMHRHAEILAAEILQKRGL